MAITVPEIPVAKPMATTVQTSAKWVVRTVTIVRRDNGTFDATINAWQYDAKGVPLPSSIQGAGCSETLKDVLSDTNVAAFPAIAEAAGAIATGAAAVLKARGH